VSQEVLIVFCTCPNETVSRLIADDLVSRQLAACVSMIPGIQSVYEWQGQLEHSLEVQLMIKTTPAAYAALETRIRVLHPYEVPECLAISVERGASGYMDWVRTQVKPVEV
jgi:periplasmic divalent cation tolerance protein